MPLHVRGRVNRRMAFATIFGDDDEPSGEERLQQYLDAINANKVGNLLLFLPLNETSGTEALDSSGNNYHADYFGSSTIVGGASGPLSGNVAPQMGGTENAVLLNNATWRTTFDGTKGHLSFWVKLDELVNESQEFVALWSNSSFERITVSKSGTNTLRAQYIPFSGASVVITSNTPELFSWTNVQVSWSDSNGTGTVTLYVNGTQVATNNTIATAWTGTTLNIYALASGTNAGTASPLDGAIALFSVFDEVQDTDSISALATLPGGVQS